LKNIY